MNKEVIALCYHAQKVNQEYEIYLTGHDDYYEDHTTWLVERTMSPKIIIII